MLVTSNLDARFGIAREPNIRLGDHRRVAPDEGL